MNQDSASTPSRFFMFEPHRRPVVWVVCIGVALSLTAFFMLRSRQRSIVERMFQVAAEERANAVKNAFKTELAMMELVRSALVADGRIERDEFQEMSRPFLAHAEDIRAVEWIPRVPKNKRNEFEAAAVRGGLPGFQITEMTRDGELAPARQREEYYPIYYVGPIQNDKRIYGYDLASEPERFDCLQLSRDSGQTVASGRIDFVNEPDSPGGFLVAFPVYALGTRHKTLEERRENLAGFILGVFRPSDMIASALRKLQPEGIDVALCDPTDKHNHGIIYYHASRMDRVDVQPDTSRLMATSATRYSVQLGLAGHPWTIVCAPTAEFYAAHLTWWPVAALAAGLMFTFMSAGFLLYTVERNVQLEERVQQQTKDIRSTQEEVLLRLASASQCSDSETPMHLRRIGLMSQALARAVDWLDEDVDAIRQAAPMHDVGKVGVPEAIRRNTGPLTPQEADLVKSHTRIGGEILAGSSLPMLKMAHDIALNHHEHWDGNGYPRGIAGREIPESARIVAIVDAFDSLTHDAPGRPALSVKEAIMKMQQENERQFDPALLAAFVTHLDEMQRICESHPNRTHGAPPATSQGSTPVAPVTTPNMGQPPQAAMY